MIRMPALREFAINPDDETTVRRGAWGTRTFASVRHTEVDWSEVASVDHTEAGQANGSKKAMSHREVE